MRVSTKQRNKNRWSTCSWYNYDRFYFFLYVWLICMICQGTPIDVFFVVNNVCTKISRKVVCGSVDKIRTLLVIAPSPNRDGT